MPPKINPKCIQCEKVESMMWRPLDIGYLCQECYGNNSIKSEHEQDSENICQIEEKKLRKSGRTTRYKSKVITSTKSATKGRNRRSVFKRSIFKAPPILVTTRSVKSVYYKGSHIQIGDIVSLMDSKDNIFYAQIRGLLVDLYCEKSAYITWLIPTQSSPPPNERFDPSTYLIGPDEDEPRPLSFLEFVMHAPSSYYYDKSTQFSVPSNSLNIDSPSVGYYWTRIPENERKRLSLTTCPVTSIINSPT